MHLQLLFAAIAFGAVVLAAAGRVPLWLSVFFLALIELLQALPWKWA